MCGRFALSGLVALVLATAGRAQVLFSDGFESYAPGALDKNLTGGPNAAPNGSGNPWFGPAPPNARVVGAEGSVTPHTGSQMIRGLNTGPNDFDQNWYNLAYRLSALAPSVLNEVTLNVTRSLTVVMDMVTLTDRDKELSPDQQKGFLLLVRTV